MAAHDILVVNLSGRGDKDMGILARELKIAGSVKHEQTPPRVTRGDT